MSEKTTLPDILKGVLKTLKEIGDENWCLYDFEHEQEQIEEVLRVLAINSESTISISKGVAEHYASLIPVILKRDNDGHWYVIPVQLADEFTRLLEQSGEHNLGCYEAQQKFIEKFNQYSTGGDLNNTQLYVLSKTDKEQKFSFPHVTDEYLKALGVDALNRLSEPIKPSALEMVEEFHQAFDCPVYVKPTLPSYQGAYEEVQDLFEKLENRFKYSKNTSICRGAPLKYVKAWD
jgi:hypothetical protein